MSTVEERVDIILNKTGNILKTFIEQLNTKIEQEGATPKTFTSIVSNPPYQLENNTSASENPVYHLFIDVARIIGKQVSFIHPARFLFNAGKTPKEWNLRILSDKEFYVIEYKVDSKYFFSSVGIAGGVAITFFKKGKIDGGYPNGFTVHKELETILEKISQLLNEKNLSNIVSTRKPYKYATLSIDPSTIGVPTNAFKKPGSHWLTEEFENSYKFLGLGEGNKRTYRYISRNKIRNTLNINKYKVFIPKAAGPGIMGQRLSTPLIGTPLVGCTETFIEVGPFETLGEAEACLKYIKTKFARALLGTLKVTQDNTKEKWRNIPLQDFTVNSDIDWSLTIPEIDQQLYIKYGLTEEEIEFIETNIQEMV